MMTATLGVATILATLAIGRAAKIRTHIDPIPWWLSDNMSANAVVPALVTSFVVGIGILISSLVTQKWAVFELTSLIGIAACIAGFVVCWRLLTAWSLRVEAAVAPAVAAARNDATQPPGVPPLKKAA